MAEKYGYRSLIVLTLIMALLSSCSQSQVKQESYMNANTNTKTKTKTKTTPREVLGFYTEQEGTFPGSQPAVNLHFTSMSIIAPFWYKLDDQQPGHLKASVTAEHKIQVIQEAHRKHLKVYMVVHNLFYETVEKGKQVASNVLANDANRDVFIQNIRNEINEFKYDGLNIDMENLESADREAFSLMIKKLSDAVHPDGKVVTVSVPANTGDSRANPWSKWFDYKKLGQNADSLMIMTYDEHNPRTKPGSSASVGWTEATIRYALKQGVPSSKILLGIAGYGWDWDTTTNKAVYSSYKLLMDQKTKYKAKVMWDSRSKTPHFSYIDRQHHNHEAWFENGRSLGFKLDLVEKYNLRGIGIWRLGLEDPKYWTTIPEKIEVKK